MTAYATATATTTSPAAGRYDSLAEVGPAVDTETLTVPFVAAMAFLHVGLGLAVSIQEQFVRVHGLVVICATLLIALTNGAARLPYAMAYVAGSEVLWRFKREGLPWETAKYLCILAAVVAIVRFRRTAGPPLLLLAFVLLLLPSILVPAGQADITDKSLRQGTLTTLAPAFALGAMAWGLTTVEARAPYTPRVLLALVLPIISIGTLTAHRTFTAEQITFTGESNFATSGGFGPNQVSTILGLGAMAALLIAALDRRRSMALLAVTIASGLAVQSAMTFSRGGIYAVVLSLLAGVMLAPSSPIVRRAFVPALAVVSAGLALVLPAMNAFTGGALLRRFQETSTSNRWELLLEDLSLFLDHPLLGVGPGQSKHARTAFEGAASHTEFSRLLSEHGSLGLIAMVCLLLFVVLRLRKARDADHRFVMVAIACWSLASQVHAALRTLAPVLMLALLNTQITHARHDSARH